jgi:phosphatidylserine/phosphatidylglycerophosphate/cardiolipin synthase-like enzyme
MAREPSADTRSMPVVDARDGAPGRVSDRSIVAHHRRRLRRLGRLEALAPADDASPWCREAPPARDGCSIDVLVDGAEMLPAIAEAIRAARRSVRIAGWHQRRRDLRGHDATVDFDVAASHARELNLGRRRKRHHLRRGAGRCTRRAG